MEAASAIVQNEMWDKALESALSQTAGVVERSRGVDLAVLFAGSSYAGVFPGNGPTNPGCYGLQRSHRL